MNYSNHSKDSRANLGGFDLSEQSDLKKKKRKAANEHDIKEPMK